MVKVQLGFLEQLNMDLKTITTSRIISLQAKTPSMAPRKLRRIVVNQMWLWKAVMVGDPGVEVWKVKSEEKEVSGNVNKVLEETFDLAAKD